MTKKTTKNLPVKAKSTELITVNQEKISPLDITQKLHHLKSRADVRKYLPDILGRVLARVWIDTGFKEEFAKDMEATKDELSSMKDMLSSQRAEGGLRQSKANAKRMTFSDIKNLDAKDRVAAIHEIYSNQ